jgi:hypothetical protein
MAGDPAKGLEAARDVAKQVLTIDAALLTFGLTFLKDVVKTAGSTAFNTAAIALLISAGAGMFALFAIVEKTHSGGGINAGWIRFPLLVNLAGLVVGVIAIAVFVT